MATDIPAAVPILAALIGAAGALLGIAISFGRDWYGQKLKDGQQRNFVALRIAAELDDFAIRCTLAAGDHGQPEIQQCGQEEYVPEYPSPDFQLDYSSYDWRLLPKDLLMRILELPHLTKRAHVYLSEVIEYGNDPPYHQEYFNERSLQFGRLGLKAAQVARDLRLKVGAPPEMAKLDPDDAYDVCSHLQDIVYDVLKTRRANAESADA